MMNNLTSEGTLKGSISSNASLSGSITNSGTLKGSILAGGSGGVKEIYVNDIQQEVSGSRADIAIEYEMLPDKPLINDKELIGGINNGYYADSRITNTELENIFNDW